MRADQWGQRKDRSEPTGNWLESALMGMLGAPNDYEARKIARTEASGLIVSTCWTQDFGYETAILDRNGAHPVDRYETKPSAVEGHQKWLESLPSIDIVKKLGTADGLVEDEYIKLERV